jgi:FkbM family methyltransferase
VALMSKLRHSRPTRFIRAGLRWIHRHKYREGAPLPCVVAPGREFQIYPKGELIDFLPFMPLFERTEMQLVARLLKPHMNVIDAGANIGIYSLLAAKCIGDDGKIWSFEPSQTTFNLFLDNIALNQVKTVSAHRLALSDAQGQLTLRSENGFGDLYRHLDYGGKAAPGDLIETVDVSTLDDFAASNNIDEIDFLKIDVEGGEYCLLKGSQHLLSRSPNVIVMVEIEEDWCLRNGFKTEDAFELLRSLGFTLYSWSKRQARWSTDASELSKSRTVWATRNSRLLDDAVLTCEPKA